MGNITDERTDPSKKVTSVVSTKRMPPNVSETRVVGATAAPTELRSTYEGSEGYVNREELAESTEDNNYKEICANCVIRDIAKKACNHCGIYHYVARLKNFKIRVTRR